MTRAILPANRYILEQALKTARRFGSRQDVTRTQRMLAKVDKRKSVARWQRLGT